MVADSRLTELARRYPRGCRLTPSQRIVAYFAIGGLMPKGTWAGGRAGVYGKGVVKAFLGTWNKAGGMAIGKSTICLARQIATVFTRAQIDTAVAGGVSWRVLRELAHRRVPPALRTKLLDTMCRGSMTASELSRRLDAQCGHPRLRRRPGDLQKVGDRLLRHIDDLEGALGRMAERAERERGAGNPAAVTAVKKVARRLTICVRKLQRRVRRVSRGPAERRRRSPTRKNSAPTSR
jgi:hypothetical protein